MMLWDLVQKHGIKTLRSIPAESRTRFDHPSVRRLWQAAHELGITVDIFLMQLEWAEGAERMLREFSHLTVAFWPLSGPEAGRRVPGEAGGGPAAGPGFPI